MSKQFEDLTKNLASGMSRRKAFLRFGAGFGAVIGGLLTRRSAHAGPSDLHGEACVDFCRELDFSNPNDFGQCVSACQRGLVFNATT